MAYFAALCAGLLVIYATRETCRIRMHLIYVEPIGFIDAVWCTVCVHAKKHIHAHTNTNTHAY